MIRHGIERTFDVQGQAGEFQPRTVAGVRSDVIDGLTPFFDVADVAIVTPSFLSDPTAFFVDWRYAAVVRATPRADYGDVRDVDSIVAHAFYDAAGELPTVTARGLEAGQGKAQDTSGLSLTTALVLVAIGLVAVAVIKVA